MKHMSELITKLENHQDLEVSIIQSTKIHKGIIPILKLPKIPNEEEFQFKPRLQKLLDKWNNILASEQKTFLTSASRPSLLEFNAPALNRFVEGDDTSTIQYPKLSENSSFMSQVSDHGRQPDATFDDSAALDINSTKASSSEDGFNRPEDVLTDVEQQTRAPKGAREDIQSTRFTFNHTSKSQPRESTNKLKKAHNKRSVLIDCSSSDSDVFPTFEQLSQDQFQVKEKRSHLNISKAAAEEDLAYRKAMDTLDKSISEDEEGTPKASQQGTRKYSLRPSPRRASRPLASTMRDLQPPAAERQARMTASQSIFSVSQNSAVVDLTQASSDNEVEQNDDGNHSSDGYLRTFKRPEMSDSDEGQHEKSSERGKKRASSPTGTQRRKVVKGSPKTPSQGSPRTPRTRSRRKTSSL